MFRILVEVFQEVNWMWTLGRELFWRETDWGFVSPQVLSEAMAICCWLCCGSGGAALSEKRTGPETLDVEGPHQGGERSL